VSLAKNFSKIFPGCFYPSVTLKFLLVNIYKSENKIYNNLMAAQMSDTVTVMTRARTVMRHRHAKGGHHTGYCESDQEAPAKAGAQSGAAGVESRAEPGIPGAD